ncbi:hypothetical protein E143388_07047 [Rhodococcus opacus]|nr:hypothetical protein E143388_07047 [Rhodococcus opacus]
MRCQCDAERDTRIGEHVGDACGGIARVDREESRPGLGDRPDREHRVDGTRNRQGNVAFRAGAVRDQQAREPVRRLVEVAVTHRATGVLERDGVRIEGCGVGDDRGERAGGGCGTTAHGRERAELVVAEKSHRRDGRLRCRRDDLQCPAHVGRDRLGVVAAEELRQKLELEVECGVGGGGGGECEGVVGGVGGGGGGDGEVGGWGGVVGVVLVDGDGVEGGGVGVGDVGEGGGRWWWSRSLLCVGGVGVVEEGGEGVGGVEGDADGDGVDEESDHGFDAGDVGWASGDGGAEGDVGGAGVGGEDEGPGGVEDGVEGEVVGAGHGPQPIGVLP